MDCATDKICPVPISEEYVVDGGFDCAGTAGVGMDCSGYLHASVKLHGEEAGRDEIDCA